MIRAIALMILGLVSLAPPAMACSTSGSSTFCSDGWLSQQPVRAARGQDDDPDAAYADPSHAEGQGDPASPDQIYVEGAVTIADDGSDGGGL